MRATEHHAIIEELLGQSSGPLSADEVRSSIGVRNISQATVYRVLKKATVDGMFKEVSFPDGPKRYELASHAHHHHFICLECDRAFDLKGCPEKINNLAPDGFEVQGHDLILKGLCPQCKS
jgi:Fur family ferric uptake transcriptional regulator